MVGGLFSQSIIDWGQGDWERNVSLFYDEHKKYDKRIVAKAFVDAYIKKVNGLRI